jgi:hypothetical protein
MVFGFHLMKLGRGLILLNDIKIKAVGPKACVIFIVLLPVGKRHLTAMESSRMVQPENHSLLGGALLS